MRPELENASSIKSQSIFCEGFDIRVPILVGWYHAVGLCIDLLATLRCPLVVATSVLHNVIPSTVLVSFVGLIHPFDRNWQ